jgi:hypothetical protein
MPLKVGTEIIIDDDKGLNRIASLDDTTTTTINDAIDPDTFIDALTSNDINPLVTQARVNELVVAQDNVLIIRDAGGSIVKKIYGGEE